MRACEIPAAITAISRAWSLQPPQISVVAEHVDSGRGRVKLTVAMLGLIHPPVPVQSTVAQVHASYANGLTVRADRLVADPQGQSVEWIGNVEATYGPTKLTADRMTLKDSEIDPFGAAVGHVRLIDPEGTLSAASLDFHWKTKTGSAQNVVVQVSTLRLEAESIDIRPGLWTLRNVGGTGCSAKNPLYYIHTRELQIRPSEGIRAVRPQLSIFGRKVATFPDQGFSFAGGGGSIDVPYPTYRQERGFGINWSPAFSLAPETLLTGRYAVFQRSRPFYNATVMHSLISGRNPEVVRTEIGDRFGFRYFDSVQVRTPQSEQDFTRRGRLDLGAASTFGAEGRESSTLTSKVDKPIEFLAHASGPLGGFGIYGLARWQRIQVGGGSRKSRLIFEQSLSSPLVALAPKLSAFGGIDAAQFVGSGEYGWVRGQVGLSFDAARQVRLGIGFSSARAYGTPDFAFDEPFRFREVNFRSDFDFDTTQLRVLVKYDPSSRQVFDREFYLSQVIGCIEPFVVYRERPRKFFVGIKLPISRAFERISQAEEERRKAIRSVISGSDG